MPWTAPAVSVPLDGRDVLNQNHGFPQLAMLARIEVDNPWPR